MDENSKQQLRDFITQTLAQHGDHRGFADDEPLFSSGRLDSFSMMNLAMFLEESFGIDFSNLEFEVALVDSVIALTQLIEAQRAA